MRPFPLLVLGIWAAFAPPRLSQFERSVQSALRQLNLTPEKLPGPARKRMEIEVKAVHHAAPRFNPRQLAMRIFVWYSTEYKPLDLSAYSVPGALTAAIPIMRRWATSNPKLSSFADKEINVLVKLLCEGFENSGRPKEQVLEAQAYVLALAAGREDKLEEDMKAAIDWVENERKNAR